MGRDIWSSTTWGTWRFLQISLNDTRFTLYSIEILLNYVLPKKKEFDVMGPLVLMTVGGNRLFDYVGVFEDETSALLTPALTEESTILSTIKPFQPIVSFF
jgi:hypothetical protein